MSDLPTPPRLLGRELAEELRRPDPDAKYRDLTPIEQSYERRLASVWQRANDLESLLRHQEETNTRRRAVIVALLVLHFFTLIDLVYWYRQATPERHRHLLTDAEFFGTNLSTASTPSTRSTP